MLKWIFFLKGGKTDGLEVAITRQLKEMNQLKELLRKKRIKQGSIDFTTREQCFVLQKNEIKTVFLKEPLESEKLIEEFMLVANCCAAWELKKRGGGIFRVHGSPKEEQFLKFEQTLFRKKMKLPKGGYLNPLQVKGRKKVMPNRLMLFLDALNDPVEKQFYSLLLLRSMNRAQYAVENIGHYGLAFNHYTHFTSPIRRYPDLIVHRLLLDCSGNLEEVDPQKGLGRIQRRELADVANSSSDSERKAVEAEREYRKLKSMRYLEKNKEMVFDALINGFNHRGVFVQDCKTGIEGVVDHSYLDPLIQLNDVGNALVLGDQVVYELGGQIRVKLLSLHFSKLLIKLVPVE